MTDAAHKDREQALIAAIVAGETQLYHDLIRPHEKVVYMVVLSYVKNSADAEDIAQEAFLQGFRSLASFRGEAKFSSWVITIALNLARRKLRKAATFREVSIDDPGEEDNPPVAPAMLRDWREIPSEAVERNEVRALLREAIAKLPEIYRTVFVLREMEQSSGEETAAALGITHALVKVRLHRARMMLQKELAPTLRAATAPPKRRWLPWN